MSDVKAHLCWEVFFWDSVLVMLVGGFVTVLSSDMWVCVYLIGILLAFCKMGNSGSLHEKNFSCDFMIKEKDNFLTVYKNSIF